MISQQDLEGTAHSRSSHEPEADVVSVKRRRSTMSRESLNKANVILTEPA